MSSYPVYLCVRLFGVLQRYVRALSLLECVYAFRQYRYGIVPYVMRKCAVGLDRLF